MKKIGILLRNFTENDKLFIGTRRDLFEKIYEYNVLVLGIPTENNFEKSIDLIKLCDGIILSGGDRFIENDFKLVKYLYENDIPTLGICLGMQSMGRYFSNIEESDVYNHQLLNNECHYININKKSLLYNILETERLLVNSRHNSRIVDTDLFVSAVSDDGVIEGIEDASKKFFIGVEWHPESMNDIYSKKLFSYFINLL